MNEWLNHSYSLLPHVPISNENRIGTLINRCPRSIKQNSLRKMALLDYIYLRDLTWYVEWNQISLQNARKPSSASNIYHK